MTRVSVIFSGALRPCGQAVSGGADGAAVAGPLGLRVQPPVAMTPTASTATRRTNISEHGVAVEHRSVDTHTLHGRSLRRAHLYGAAGAAADRARHELLERHL